MFIFSSELEWKEQWAAVESKELLTREGRKKKLRKEEKQRKKESRVRGTKRNGAKWSTITAFSVTQVLNVKYENDHDLKNIYAFGYDINLLLTTSNP